MKAYKVTLTDCDSAIALAETPGQATVRAIREALGWGVIDGWWDVEWKEIRRKRLPELDGDTLTERQLVEGGYMWVECTGCGEPIGHNAPGSEPSAEDVRTVAVVWNEHGAPFCSQECMAAHADWTPDHRPCDCVLLSVEF